MVVLEKDEAQSAVTLAPEDGGYFSGIADRTDRRRTMSVVDGMRFITEASAALMGDPQYALLRHDVASLVRRVEPLDIQRLIDSPLGLPQRERVHPGRQLDALVLDVLVTFDDDAGLDRFQVIGQRNRHRHQQSGGHQLRRDLRRG